MIAVVGRVAVLPTTAIIVQLPTIATACYIMDLI
jgi:hypothetical protein